MLVALTICLVIASLMILFIKRNKEAMLLVGLCFSLALQMCGVMIFIAKKGGVSQDVMQFLYFSKFLQDKIRYLRITLDQLGYLVALGRTLYPLFLLEIAIHYSMIPWIRKSMWLERAVPVLPVLTLLGYYPYVYHKCIVVSETWQTLLMRGSFFWITGYMLMAILLLMVEYHAITMQFCKRQFVYIMVCLVTMTILYVLHYQQDPGQIYRFYSYNFLWSKGVGYLQINPSVKSYVWLVLISTICSIMGFYSLLRYTTDDFGDSREDVVMQRKFNTAKVGASMFVHGMKNQLLSTKVIYKRITQLYEQPEVDTAKVKEYIDSLEDFNNAMLERVEELYRSVRTKAILMVPINVDEVIEDALERFHKKYPNASADYSPSGEMMILADKSHLCEAVYNLLINAEEAVQEAERGVDGRVSVRCYNERLYTIIEVKDNGRGMTKSQTKKIFEPFYSNKNSNYNWGMGLYYVRETVKGHLGSMRIESKPGEGSSFYILLPRYK